MSQRAAAPRSNRPSRNCHASRPAAASSRRGRIAGFAAGLVVGLAAGLAAGLGGGLSTDADPRPARTAAPELFASAKSPTPLDAGRVSPDSALAGEAGTGLLDSWLALAERERLASLTRKATGAGLDLITRTVIDQLAEDSLESLIVSATDFSSAELAELDDVPGFAKDLARIAMQGSLGDAPEPDEDVRAVDFSTEISWDHRAVGAQSQFPPDEERIYAVFESDDLSLRQALVKWTRVDDGEILLFQRHRLRPAADSSFVWLEAPGGRWQPGEYRVDFYSADTELRWIASGSHRVTL